MGWPKVQASASIPVSHERFQSLHPHLQIMPLMLGAVSRAATSSVLATWLVHPLLCDRIVDIRYQAVQSMIEQVLITFPG